MTCIFLIPIKYEKCLSGDESVRVKLLIYIFSTYLTLYCENQSVHFVKSRSINKPALSLNFLIKKTGEQIFLYR